MLSDLFHALLRGWDQLTYFRHTYSPLSPWRARTDAVVTAAGAAAARYGIRTPIDRRRAYQVARMVVRNRNGDHLVDVVPDAYLAFSPPSAATFHAGRRTYDAPAARRAAFLVHPQTLAYLLTSPKLSRRRVGASGPGHLGVVDVGEGEVDTQSVVARLQEATAGRAADADLRAFAEVLVRLHAGLPAEAGDSDGSEGERAAA